MRTKAVSLLLAVLAVTAVAVTGASAARTQASKNIVEKAVAAGNFETLVQLVQDAGLEETLAEDGPFTVFAPTDEAFDAVPDETLAALAADPEELKRVLLYHVVAGRYPARRVVKKNSLKTLAGPRVDVTYRKRKGIVKVGGARVIAPDVRASNGVIHAIDRVLIPPS